MAGMVTLPGLTDQQSQVFRNVQVGDFLLFQKSYVPPQPAQVDDDDSSEDDESESGDDGGDEGDEDAVENDAGESEDEDEPAGSDGEGMSYASDESATSPLSHSLHGGNDDDEVIVDVEQIDSNESAESGEEDRSELEDESEDTEPTSDEADVEPSKLIPSTSLYYVKSVGQDNLGNTGPLQLVELRYALQKTDESPKHSFQLFGDEIRHSADHSDGCDCEQTTTLQQLDDEYGLAVYDVFSKNSGTFAGTFMRRALRQGHCPAGCDEGFLDALDQLSNIIDPTVYATAATLPHRPVCPVCIGIDLLKEQQDLRVTLEAFHMVDFGQSVEFIGRLNPIRLQNGYSFHQYDERDFGYYFDDMAAQDEDVDDDRSQYEDWEEAMDPSAHVQFHPASKAAIAALPRMTFDEVTEPEGLNEDCVICKEKFGESTAVIELPCRHVFHALDCVTTWLETSGNCPTCRAKLPVVREAEEQENAQQVEDAGTEGMGEGEEVAMEDV